MTHTDPSTVHPAWAAAFNAKDTAAMIALCEEGYVFSPQPGVAVTGADADAAQEQFVAMGLPIDLTVRNVITAGDLALVIADWTIKGTAADGNEVDLAGSTSDVLRNGADGWKFVIDNPFGTV